MPKKAKTIIGILASHDDNEINEKLARLFEDICKTRLFKKKLKNYHFIITGGTFDRLFGIVTSNNINSIDNKTQQFLINQCGITRLPDRKYGGVTLLSFFVTQQKCSIIWPFLTPLTTHWLNPENLALTRLCDQWHVKRLMNKGSVLEWISEEAEYDINRNLQELPFSLIFHSKVEKIGDFTVTASDNPTGKNNDLKYLNLPIIRHENHSSEINVKKSTIALIAHDEMKARMIEFAIDNENELSKFQRIISTGTTGREVAANTRTLEDKIDRYHSGPKGGDIEIATEILYGRCDVVFFFIDPLNPHPHIEDIRVVFTACMINDKVRMLTNEMQAREWIQRVVRGK